MIAGMDTAHPRVMPHRTVFFVSDGTGITAETLGGHELHSERYEVDHDAWERIGAAPHVTAIGTTTVRVLESPLLRAVLAAGRAGGDAVLAAFGRGDVHMTQQLLPVNSDGRSVSVRLGGPSDRGAGGVALPGAIGVYLNSIAAAKITRLANAVVVAIADSIFRLRENFNRRFGAVIIVAS